MSEKSLIFGTLPLRNERRFILWFIAILLVAAPSGWSLPDPGSFVTSGPPTSKRISLTFDDGPGPETTQLLELLDQYNVKATFFMLGEQVKYRPAIAKSVAQRGHEIANHTTRHINYLSRYRALEGEFGTDTEAPQKAAMQVRRELLEDMKDSKSFIENKTGATVKLCRMPHGVDRPWVNDAAKEAGLVMVNWTYGADWLETPEAELEKSYVSEIKPGAILLFHDGGKNRKKTLRLTETVIKAAKERGYEIVPVGELLK